MLKLMLSQVYEHQLTLVGLTGMQSSGVSVRFMHRQRRVSFSADLRAWAAHYIKSVTCIRTLHSSLSGVKRISRSSTFWLCWNLMSILSVSKGHLAIDSTYLGALFRNTRVLMTLAHDIWLNMKLGYLVLSSSSAKTLKAMPTLSTRWDHLSQGTLL